MGRDEDLTGKRFGTKVILRRGPSCKEGDLVNAIKWVYECSKCGRTGESTLSNLRRGLGCKVCRRVGKCVEKYTGFRSGNRVMTGRTRVDTNPNGSNRRVWEVRCDCGRFDWTSVCNIKNSLMCPACGGKKPTHRKHGHTTAKRGTPEYTTYTTWRMLRDRCNNPNNKRYDCYGGRGISVCARWDASYEDFLKDMGLRPFPKAQIDRIDNNKGYSPDNCRWTSPTVNARNTRKNIHLTLEGETKCLSEWAEALGVPYSRLHSRVAASPDKALITKESLTTPVGEERKKK